MASWIAGWVWVLGMIAMAVYAAVSYLRLRRIVRVSMPAGEGVYLCDHIASPFILGIVRPRIYLPSELPQENWACILAHERAHLARRDHWWKPLGFLLLTVFWFQPLLWLAYILLCRDVEQACDEKVIQSLSESEKREYSQVLLECSVPGKWITACPLAFGETGVKHRIRAVLHYKKPTLWILIIALIACTVLAVCFLTDPADTPDDTIDPSVITYTVGNRIAGIVNTGYFVELEGCLRITADNTLEFAAPNVDANGNQTQKKWVQLGQMEEITLNRSHFAHLPDDSTCAGIRENNEKAWRIATVDGLYHYFLQQTDGSCYLLYAQRWLYELRSSAWNHVAGRSFLYEKSETGWEFVISLREDGTFHYHEGTLSSHIGMGTWTLDGDLLCLSETRQIYPNLLDCAYYFRVTENSMVFQAENSAEFTYVTVADGEEFFVMPQTKPEQSGQRHVMWVEIEKIGKDHMYVVDEDANRYKVMVPEDIDWESLSLLECWVSYYGEPTKIREQLSGNRIVQFKVTAEKCWIWQDAPAGVDESKVARIYDYCHADMDLDGITETCVLSMGHTSGISTFIFSVWQNGVCEGQWWVHEGSHSRGLTFVGAQNGVQNGLQVLSSNGSMFHFLYTDEILRVSDADGRTYTVYPRN